MFDISTRLVSEQDEISGLETIGWENHSWKYLSLIGDERVINLQRTKVNVFSFSVLFLGKILETHQSNDVWEQGLGWFKTSPNYRNFDRLDGELMDFEWKILPGFKYVAAQRRRQKFTVEIGRDTREFHSKNHFHVYVQ